MGWRGDQTGLPQSHHEFIKGIRTSWRFICPFMFRPSAIYDHLSFAPDVENAEWELGSTKDDVKDLRSSFAELVKGSVTKQRNLKN